MPTGYTAKIKDGQSFNEFVLGCAKAFGACITLRDEPLDTPIPDEFQPSDYHARKLVEEKRELHRLCIMTTDQAQEEADVEYQKQLQDYERRVLENNSTKASYEAMLKLVEIWQPPTPEHEILKTFMMDQIKGSIDFDCHEPEPPKRIGYSAWLTSKIASVRWSIDYHEKEHKAELERTASRNAWIKALRESLQEK